MERPAGAWSKGSRWTRAWRTSGKTSARLVVNGPEPGRSNLEVRVPVKPNTRYRVGNVVAPARGRRLWCVLLGTRRAWAVLSGKRGQVGTTIPKQDGVWLPLSWEIVTEPATRQLSLRGGHLPLDRNAVAGRLLHRGGQRRRLRAGEGPDAPRCRWSCPARQVARSWP